MKKLFKNYNFMSGIIYFLSSALVSNFMDYKYPVEENKKLYTVSLFSAIFIHCLIKFFDYSFEFLSDIQDYRKDKETIKEIEEVEDFNEVK